MNDKQLIKIGQQLERHRVAMQELLMKIEECDHPLAKEIIEDFYGEGWPPLSHAESIIKNYLGAGTEREDYQDYEHLSPEQLCADKERREKNRKRREESHEDKQ
jgi:hypothetical protein